VWVVVHRGCGGHGSNTQLVMDCIWHDNTSRFVLGVCCCMRASSILDYSSTLLAQQPLKPHLINILNPAALPHQQAVPQHAGPRALRAPRLGVTASAKRAAATPQPPAASARAGGQGSKGFPVCGKRSGRAWRGAAKSRVCACIQSTIYHRS
jgi:hypothetical protein